MNTPIDGLSTIEQLTPNRLNCNIFSVYDYPGLTIQELLCQFFTKINEVIVLSNSVYDLAYWLVNEGLEEEVAKQLNIWLVDGTLANIINETLFSELNEKINQNTNDIINNTNNITLLTNKLKGFVSVWDYKTGTNSWTDAFEDCISNNRFVYIPVGEYDIERTLFLPNDEEGINIRGEGTNTIIKCNLNNDEFLFSSSFLKRTTINGISVDSDNLKKRGFLKFDGSLRGVTIENIWLRNMTYGIKATGSIWGKTSIKEFHMYNFNEINKENSYGIYLEGNTTFISNCEILGTYENGVKIKDSAVVSLKDFNIAGSVGSFMKFPIYVENSNRISLKNGYIEQVDPFESSNGGQKSINLINSNTTIDSVNVASGSIHINSGYANINNIYLGQNVSTVMMFNNPNVFLNNIEHVNKLNGYSTFDSNDGTVVWGNYKVDGSGMSRDFPFSPAYILKTNESQVSVLEDYANDFVDNNTKRVISSNFQGARLEFNNLKQSTTHTIVAYVRIINNVERLTLIPLSSYGVEKDGIKRNGTSVQSGWIKMITYVESTSNGEIRLNLTGKAINTSNEQEFLIGGINCYKGIRPNQS